MNFLTHLESNKLKAIITDYYQSKSKSKTKGKSEAKKEIFRKLDDGTLNFGEFREIVDEINRIERNVSDRKLQIIVLKNNVLYGYISKEKAMHEFEALKEDLLTLNDALKALYEYYFTEIEVVEKGYQIEKLQQLYNENYIYYKNKMRLMKKSDDVNKLVAESVKLSMYLTKLSEEIRTMKYDEVFVDEIDGLVTQDIALERRYRYFKNNQTVQII